MTEMRASVQPHHSTPFDAGSVAEVRPGCVLFCLLPLSGCLCLFMGGFDDDWLVVTTVAARAQKDSHECGGSAATRRNPWPSAGV